MLTEEEKIILKIYEETIERSRRVLARAEECKRELLERAKKRVN